MGNLPNLIGGFGDDGVADDDCDIDEDEQDGARSVVDDGNGGEDETVVIISIIS